MTGIINWAKENLALGNIAVTVALLAVGAVLLLLRPRWGRRWIVALALGYWFLSTPFGSALFIKPLVLPFHSIDDRREAASAGAIVVLGGGINAVKVRSYVISSPYDGTALRVIEGARNTVASRRVHPPGMTRRDSLDEVMIFRERKLDGERIGQLLHLGRTHDVEAQEGQALTAGAQPILKVYQLSQKVLPLLGRVL